MKKRERSTYVLTELSANPAARAAASNRSSSRCNCSTVQVTSFMRSLWCVRCPATRSAHAEGCTRSRGNVLNCRDRCGSQCCRNLQPSWGLKMLRRGPPGGTRFAFEEVAPPIAACSGCQCCWATAASWFAACWMSLVSVQRPRESLIALIARPASIPMAVRTGEGEPCPA